MNVRVIVLSIVLVASAIAAPVLAGPANVFVYHGAGCTGRDKIVSFETLLGRKSSGVTEFADQTGWARMLSSIDWAQRCWAGRGHRLSQSAPMLMQSGTSLKEGANSA